ncbi:FAD-binding oxidoreductase [Amaricoccus sp.]|uniref:FAD-binding oxidoreductase n=1 Tax=Amaricoccus sp. TaxID=1872485 RepID=UPI001B3F3FC0|nr:FAD-binding oxidoreductase [Amaricoccus sp.]MBP7241952.1 FAD-binding oxidoreductase [Amaricoccus sp.]
MLDQDLAASLGTALRGDVLTADDAGYDAARALYNGMIDLNPRIIARCADVADVIAAVNFGREHEIAIAIRGGGHNGAGFGSVEGGLVIDLGRMRDVRVDPAARTIRAAAGCTWGDVDHAAHAFGLAVPSGIFSTTGVGGLTLGGGHGYLSRKHGLTIDSLVEVDVVLADGRFVTANADSHPELFWALRGGGGNFGVATSFLFRGHPATRVFGGPVAYGLAEARKIMRRYRGWLPRAPEDLCVFLGLKSVPSIDPFPRERWGQRMCLLMTCFDGPEAEGRRAMAGLFEGLPEPWFDWRGEMPYPAIQSMFDPVLPSGLQWYWRADFVRDLPDAAIEAHLAEIARAPSELSVMHLYPIDGAVRRKARDATAWACRDATWSMVIAGIDPDPAKAPELKAWAHAYWEAVHPFNPGGAYPNFMMDDEASERLRETFGPNLLRLAEAKRRYDPENLFRRNPNIRPA